MTMQEEDHDMLAAELALRLLDGRDLDEARALAERDAAFAGEVAAWDARFAPLFDEIAPVEPDATVWQRIETAIGRAPANDDAEIVSLRRKVAGWRNLAGLVTAIAAVLALMVVPGVIRPERAPRDVPVAHVSKPTMMAKVIAADRSTAFVVAYWPDEAELVVTPAIASVPAGMDHELWMIGASGVPKSLGVVHDAAPTILTVAPAILAELKASPIMAVTIEQDGGSPTGKPTNAPVAAARLVTI